MQARKVACCLVASDLGEEIPVCVCGFPVQVSRCSGRVWNGSPLPLPGGILPVTICRRAGGDRLDGFSRDPTSPPITTDRPVQPGHWPEPGLIRGKNPDPNDDPIYPSILGIQVCSGLGWREGGDCLGDQSYCMHQSETNKKKNEREKASSTTGFPRWR